MLAADVTPARQDLDDLDDLRLLRLMHKWSFPELARRMDAAGYGVKQRTLYYLLQQLPEGARPRDTTAFAIRRFLEYMRAEAERLALARAASERDHEEREERWARLRAERAEAERRQAREQRQQAQREAAAADRVEP